MDFQQKQEILGTLALAMGMPWCACYDFPNTTASLFGWRIVLDNDHIYRQWLATLKQAQQPVPTLPQSMLTYLSGYIYQLTCHQGESSQSFYFADTDLHIDDSPHLNPVLSALVDLLHQEYSGDVPTPTILPTEVDLQPFAGSFGWTLDQLKAFHQTGVDPQIIDRLLLDPANKAKKMVTTEWLYHANPESVQTAIHDYIDSFARYSQFGQKLALFCQNKLVLEDPARKQRLDQLTHAIVAFLSQPQTNLAIHNFAYILTDNRFYTYWWGKHLVDTFIDGYAIHTIDFIPETVLSFSTQDQQPLPAYLTDPNSQFNAALFRFFSAIQTHPDQSYTDINRVQVNLDGTDQSFLLVCQAQMHDNQWLLTLTTPSFQLQGKILPLQAWLQQIHSPPQLQDTPIQQLLKAVNFVNLNRQFVETYSYANFSFSGSLSHFSLSYQTTSETQIDFRYQDPHCQRSVSIPAIRYFPNRHHYSLLQEEVTKNPTPHERQRNLPKLQHLPTYSWDNRIAYILDQITEGQIPISPKKSRPSPSIQLDYSS